MTTKQALKWIQDNWTKLPSSRAYEYGGSSAEATCVWFAETDNSDGYDVDIEKIGMTEGGRLFWAYASGCSCWDGDYTIHEIHDKDIKVLELNHENLKDSWEKQLVDFVEEEKKLIAG